MLNDEKKAREAIAFANKIAKKYKVKKGQMTASKWLVREREKRRQKLQCLLKYDTIEIQMTNLSRVKTKTHRRIGGLKPSFLPYAFS